MYIHAFSCVLNLCLSRKEKQYQKREGTAGNVWGQQLRINEQRAKKLSGGTGVLANSDLTCGDKDPGRD